MSRGGISLFERDFPNVAKRFPKLDFSYNKKRGYWVITGDLDICDVQGMFWETFNIRIIVPAGYPFCVPMVQELSNIVPRNIDWHINERGVCCIDIPHRLAFMSRKGISMADFIGEKIYPFFANQLYKLSENQYAGAEYGHFFSGVRQFYEEDLGLNSEKALALLISLVESRAMGRNDLCPCGSGLKFKRCHLTTVDFLKCVDAKQLKKDLAGFRENVVGSLIGVK